MGYKSWYQLVGTTLMVGALGSLAPVAQADTAQAGIAQADVAQANTAQANMAQAEQIPHAQSNVEPNRQPAQVASAPPAQQPGTPAPVEVAQYYDGTTYATPDVEPLPTIPESFNRAFYSHNGNFYDNRGIRESLRLIFGIPHFVENAIYLDGRSVNRLYREVLDQQIASDPVLRTPDLPNPYTGSILTTPLVITEEAVEAVPLFPPIRRPPVAPAAPGVGSTTTTPPRESTSPVPALW